MTRDDQIGPAQELLVAAGLEAQKAFSDMSSTVKNEISDAVFKATARLGNTLNPKGVARGVTAYAEKRASVGTLATLYVNRYGMKPVAAANKAAKEIVMDNYYFSDTFRVTRSSQLPLATAEAATQNFTSLMDFKDIDIPIGIATPEENRRLYADQIRNNGYWITNGDESGLILMAPNGVIVETLEGEPIELVWDAMRGQVRVDAIGVIN
jgi:hypothetical protein